MELLSGGEEVEGRRGKERRRGREEARGGGVGLGTWERKKGGRVRLQGGGGEGEGIDGWIYLEGEG